MLKRQAHSIFALYGRNKLLLATLSAYLLAELAVALWIYLTPSVVRRTLLINSSSRYIC